MPLFGTHVFWMDDMMLSPQKIPNPVAVAKYKQPVRNCTPIPTLTPHDEGYPQMPILGVIYPRYHHRQLWYWKLAPTLAVGPYVSTSAISPCT